MAAERKDDKLLWAEGAGNWKCSNCGETMNTETLPDTCWRWAGDHWQHMCGLQTGHCRAERIQPSAKPLAEQFREWCKRASDVNWHGAQSLMESMLDSHDGMAPEILRALELAEHGLDNALGDPTYLAAYANAKAELDRDERIAALEEERDDWKEQNRLTCLREVNQAKRIAELRGALKSLCMTTNDKGEPTCWDDRHIAALGVAGPCEDAECVQLARIYRGKKDGQ